MHGMKKGGESVVCETPNPIQYLQSARDIEIGSLEMA